MTDSAMLLSQFIDAWNRGERPDADDYVSRARDDEKPALADQLNLFLQYAPTPEYGEAARAEIRAEPAAQRIASALEGEAGLWPVLLPTLRERARLRRDQIVAQLTEMLDLEGGEKKVRRYLHEMEVGSLDPRGVSQRVLDALGAILGVSGDDLARAGDFETLGGGPPPAAAYYRARLEVDALSEMATPAASRGIEAEPDQIDRLFTGGR